MTDTEKRNLIAQWAFDTSGLSEYHLWLEDVEVNEPARCRPTHSPTAWPRLALAFGRDRPGHELSASTAKARASTSRATTR